MTDIKCSNCKADSYDIYDIESLSDNMTVQSGFRLSASKSCDNCGHLFCSSCIRT